MNERATAVLDFPRMRAGRDKTRTLFVEGCETPNWGGGGGDTGEMLLAVVAIGAPSGSKSWKRIGVWGESGS